MDDPSDPGSGYDASRSASLNSTSDSPTRGDSSEETSQSTANYTPQANINNPTTPMHTLNIPQLPNNNNNDNNNEDMDVDITGSSSSGGGREGTVEETILLMDLYDLHNKTGRYVFCDGDGKRDFYKFWIEEEREFASRKELDDKIDELHERFLRNMDKNVDGPTDPVDIDVLRYSEWVWGHEIDSCKDLTDDNDNAVDEDRVDDDSMDESGGSKDESGGSKDSASKGDGN